MTKDEVLQKANEFCNEKGYTSETLTDEFKDMFSDFFAKKNQDASIDDEKVIEDLKFNLKTAFSASSRGITSRQKSFDEKENEYKRQIEELENQFKKKKVEKPSEIELPDDVKRQLTELEAFKNQQKKNEKFKEVLELAKKNVRHDLHKSLENYANDFAITLDETSEEQAKKLTVRFQEIFKDSIGDIKPLAPKQTQKRDDEFLSSIPKVKI